jgi:tubulin epsilon
MPQSIVIQVGQAGNQIAGRFWDKILQEHARSSTDNIPIFDSSFSSFFRNVDKKNGIANISPDSQICNLKARSVLIDMEPGVIGQIKKSVIGEIFDDEQIVTRLKAPKLTNS